MIAKDPDAVVEGQHGDEREEGEEGVGALLRTLWEKNFDLSNSAD